jgi:hypothetical protein
VDDSVSKTGSLHLGLRKDRVETLALIVAAMVSARTVNLGHLAGERPGTALVASTCGRLRLSFSARTNWGGDQLRQTVTQ